MAVLLLQRALPAAEPPATYSIFSVCPALGSEYVRTSSRAILTELADESGRGLLSPVRLPLPPKPVTEPPEALAHVPLPMPGPSCVVESRALSLPPFVSTKDPRTDLGNWWCGSGSGFELGWSPVALVVDGEAIAQRLFTLSELPSHVDCASESTCIQYVRAQHPEGSITVHRCDVPVIGPVVGVPRDCEPVAFVDVDNTYLRVRSSYVSRQDHCSACAPGPKLAKLVAATHSCTNELVFEDIASRLKALPYSLDATVQKHYVYASSPYRSSVLLHPYFEKVYVRVSTDLWEPTAPDGPLAVALDVNLELLVNQRPTEGPDDWHAPSENQRDTWTLAVSSLVRASLDSLCKATVGASAP